MPVKCHFQYFCIEKAVSEEFIDTIQLSPTQLNQKPSVILILVALGDPMRFFLSHQEGKKHHSPCQRCVPNSPFVHGTALGCHLYGQKFSLIALVEIVRQELP